jgi:hypothetical protein
VDTTAGNYIAWKSIYTCTLQQQYHNAFQAERQNSGDVEHTNFWIETIGKLLDQALSNMTDETPISLGTSIPSRKHAISVHLPAWEDVVGVGSGDLGTLNALNNGYPRSNLHIDVRKVRHNIWKT